MALKWESIVREYGGASDIARVPPGDWRSPFYSISREGGSLILRLHWWRWGDGRGTGTALGEFQSFSSANAVAEAHFAKHFPLQALGAIAEENPRTALRWTYDASKMQWVAEHAGLRWFLERRDGGDPRYPREYLYQTTLGGLYLDRVAKRDVRPALTASAKKRRNIRAKEWAEGFILSDLEKLARSMKKNPLAQNPRSKKKGKRARGAQERRERGLRRGAGTVPAPMMRISSWGFPSTRPDPDYYPPKPWGRREDAWQKQISIGDRVLVMLRHDRDFGTQVRVSYAVGTVLDVDERREWEKRAQVQLDPTGGQHPYVATFYYDEIVEVIKPGHPLLQLAELGEVGE